MFDDEYLDVDQAKPRSSVVQESALMQAAARPVGVNPILSKLISRQKKSKKSNLFNNERTEHQKKIDVIQRITNPAFEREETKKRQEDRKRAQFELDQELKAMLVQMEDADLSDRAAIKDKQPAMHRFALLDDLRNMLQKKSVKHLFLEYQGCSSLEAWLEPNPDHSFPPLQVIETVFEILETLPIDEEALQSCNIARTLQKYAGVMNIGYFGTQASLPSGVVKRATHLLQRWQVSVYQLSYEYDKDGMHELKQRELKRKLAVLRSFDAEIMTRDDDLIKKPPNGVFIMQKSNFDFLEKPAGLMSDEEMVETNVPRQAQLLPRTKGGARSAKQEISHLMQMHKRTKK